MSKYKGLEVGTKIKTLRELRNGVDIIPAGSEGIIERRYSGLSLYIENHCEHCKFGQRIWITRVPPNDVELV